MAATATILDLVSIDFLSNAWVDWSDFFGVTGGRFLSMTSAAAHPTWPLWQPSWIWDERLRRLVQFFCGSLGVINLHHIQLLPKPHIPYTHRQLPTRGGICHALRSLPHVSALFRRNVVPVCEVWLLFYDPSYQEDPKRAARPVDGHNPMAENISHSVKHIYLWMNEISNEFISTNQWGTR
jgi:hypothetical protein